VVSDSPARASKGPDIILTWSSLGRRLRALDRARRHYLHSQQRHHPILLAVQILYVSLFLGWTIYTHSWPAPDLVAIFLLLFAFLAARGLSFLRDWSPFILLLLGYMALTGIAGGLAGHAHIQFPIDSDRRLFDGTLPTTFLQSRLWNPDRARWYDYAASILYAMHFVIPLVVTFLFWMWRRSHYWRFVASYLLLTYAGFVTYILYPMAPPWLAAGQGRIPEVSDILGTVQYGALANPIVLATRYFHPNPVAAMPSLHAAFPLLVWLVLWRTWPKWGWALIVYPLAVAFSVIYLGQHYAVDVLAGWGYAIAAFAVIWLPKFNQGSPAGVPQVDHGGNTVAGGVAAIALPARLVVTKVDQRHTVARRGERSSNGFSAGIKRRAYVAARSGVVSMDSRQYIVRRGR
jgi:membrane-associated phospholipid phosphatase